MEQKSLKVYEKTHERVMKLVGHNGCKSVDEVINYLIDFVSDKQKGTDGGKHDGR